MNQNIANNIKKSIFTFISLVSVSAVIGIYFLIALGISLAPFYAVAILSWLAFAALFFFVVFIIVIGFGIRRHLGGHGSGVSHNRDPGYSYIKGSIRNARYYLTSCIACTFLLAFLISANPIFILFSLIPPIPFDLFLFPKYSRWTPKICMILRYIVAVAVCSGFPIVAFALSIQPLMFHASCILAILCYIKFLFKSHELWSDIGNGGFPLFVLNKTGINTYPSMIRFAEQPGDFNPTINVHRLISLISK